MEMLTEAVSPRHCASTSVLRNCCFNCRSWAESQRQCPLHCCWGTTRSERSPTFAAQLLLPAHDLFWALMISSGLTWGPSSTSLLMISSGLTWGSSSTSLLLISPGTVNCVIIVLLPACGLAVRKYHPCHCQSLCVLKWNCCNNHFTPCLVKDWSYVFLIVLLYCILL